MYILLKTDKVENIKVLNENNFAHYFYANSLDEAKAYLDELQDTDNKEYWSKYYAKANSMCCQEFREYLRKTILETNKLSIKEIDDLCSELLYWLDAKPNRTPVVEIKATGNATYSNSCSFQNIWQELVKIIDIYTQTKHNIRPWDCPWKDRDLEFNPVKDLNLIFPFETDSNYFLSNCGALNMRFYKLIYYFDFLGIPIKDTRLKEFWKFYKRTMGVYAIGYTSNWWKNAINVIPKPNEIFIENGVTHCVYGDDCYCDGIKTPRWLYNTKKDNLKISDFNKLTNTDHRTVFIKKAGIEKLIKKGTVIDSYENYPENEWWAKSEYKLIDMRKILVKKIAKNRHSGKITRREYYDYAPYLCMKNQTTGVYHLEGVNPKCKDLYDALKMRYKDLNLPDYEIKNIK